MIYQSKTLDCYALDIEEELLGLDRFLHTTNPILKQ